MGSQTREGCYPTGPVIPAQTDDSMTKPSANRVDALIVGQGLAGSLLAHALDSEGLSVAVADPGHGGSASMAAAGAMNPCASARYTAPAPLDLWLDHAVSTWQGLERRLDTPLFQPQLLCRLFRDAREAGRVKRQRRHPALARVVSAPVAGSPPGLSTAPGHVLIRSARVDLPAFLAATRQWLAARGALRERSCHPDDVAPSAYGISWRGIDARVLVLCQGAVAARHPGLRRLPWRLSRGEALYLEADDEWPDMAVSRGPSLIPVDGERYWLGATYGRELQNPLPGTRARTTLLASLEQLLAGTPAPRVIAQHVGVRPGSRTELPFCCRVPGKPPVYLLNGLGSRGTLLGPRCATTLSRHLAHGTALPPEWNPWGETWRSA